MNPSVIFLEAANEKIKEQNEIIRILKEENKRLLRDPLVMPSACIKCSHLKDIDWLKT